MRDQDRKDKGENTDWVEQHCGAFTPEEHRRILAMLADYEHRQWLIGWISRIAKWFTTVAAAIMIGQQLWVKWLVK